MADGCATALCVDGSLGANGAGPAAVFWVYICMRAKSYMVHVLLSKAFVMGPVSYFWSLCVVSGELVFKVCRSSMGRAPQQYREQGSGMASWTFGRDGGGGAAQLGCGRRYQSEDAHWGGLAWEQMARLQHLRVAMRSSTNVQNVVFGTSHWSR